MFSYSFSLTQLNRQTKTLYSSSCSSRLGDHYVYCVDNTPLDPTGDEWKSTIWNMLANSIATLYLFMYF